MKPMKNLLLMGLLSALGAGGALAAERSHFTHFITRDGATLKDGDKVFRFAGIHAPELHRIEDDARGPCRADPRGWGQYFKWPTAQEQQNWIQAMVQTGAKAQRVYVLSVQQEFDKACGRETHILAPETADGMPRLNEKAMRVDEKAIMAWETGNELEDTNADFLHQTAAWIKKWAPHQLVVDGTYKKINSFALTDPNVDIVSNHYYTNADNNHPGQVTQDLRAVGGQKVYLVGEFGLLPADQLNAIMQSIVHSEVNGAQAAGGLIWGFRGHRHDGGFYWHKESTGHYSYHLPGFAKEGEANQEQAVVDLVRTAAAQMAGQQTMAPLPKPEAPLLRETTSPFAINWMGAAVGRSYDVERAASPTGPWTVVGRDISDGVNEWNPETMVLFRDDYRQLQLGHTYYYRVTAKNESGRSAPSNVISVQHSEENQPPVVTLEPALTTTQDQGVELTASWQDDGLPSREVKVGWQHAGDGQVHFCHADRVQTRAWFTAPGTYALTFTADDGLLKSSKTVTVTVGEAAGKAPADFCRYHGEVYGVAEGRLTVMKSDKGALTVGEDGFLGPFANEGDKVSWQVQAPWSGQFLLNVTFNGKWGGKQNSFVVNGGAPQTVAFPQTDEQGQQLRIPVTLKAGTNQIDFGRFAGDWGYMFIKSIEVVAE